jgi:carbon storage regulator
MLVISRHVNETIVIGGGMVVITVVRLEHGKVRIGIDAPKELIVDRGEVHERRQQNAEKEMRAHGNSSNRRRA